MKLRAQKIFLPSVTRAYVHFSTGDVDAGFEALERPVEERSSSLLYLLVSPVVDPIRADPRFKAIVRRVNPAVETFSTR